MGSAQGLFGRGVSEAGEGPLVSAARIEDGMLSECFRRGGSVWSAWRRSASVEFAPRELKSVGQTRLEIEHFESTAVADPSGHLRTQLLGAGTFRQAQQAPMPLR